MHDFNPLFLQFIVFFEGEIALCTVQNEHFNATFLYFPLIESHETLKSLSFALKENVMTAAFER